MTNNEAHQTNSAADSNVVALPIPAPTTPAGGGDEGGKGGKGELDASPSSPSSPAPAARDVTPSPLPPLGDDVYRPAPDTNPVLDALKAAGLYQRHAGGNEHRVTCPWASEHAPGKEVEAYYFEPNESVPKGSFFCPCPKHDKKRIGSTLKHLGVSPEDASCKPRIRVMKGDIHRSVRAAETVLAGMGGFYSANDSIVRLRSDPVTGDVATEQMTAESLTLTLSAAADFYSYDKRSEAWVRCDVPRDVVNNALKSGRYAELTPLNGLARQPFFRRTDDALVRNSGYDRASGIFAAFDPVAFDLPKPTRENALAAMARMNRLLDEFEFAEASDRATALCAMLTAAVREYLPLAPAFNITASSPGSGKSYLASVITPFAGPGEARSISYPSSNEEATKVVLSLALEQPSVVCFDDMYGDWQAWGAMNRMLTSGSVTERLLGSSRVVTARTSSFIMGTGNNIRPVRDMARRVASIYLLPKTEAAATREFKGSPADEVRGNRGRYVSDALTIIMAWIASGRQRADVTNIAGFESWSDLCRHSLISLGQPDPATSLIAQITHDPDAEQLGDLLRAWHDIFGEKPTLVRQVLNKIDHDPRSDLHDAIMELPCVQAGKVNQSRFGRHLGRNKNRIVNGLQLVEAPHSERRAWSVIRVSEKAKPTPATQPPEPEATPEQAWMNVPNAA